MLNGSAAWDVTHSKSSPWDEYLFSSDGTVALLFSLTNDSEMYFSYFSSLKSFVVELQLKDGADSAFPLAFSIWPSEILSFLRMSTSRRPSGSLPRTTRETLESALLMKLSATSIAFWSHLSLATGAISATETWTAQAGKEKRVAGSGRRHFAST